MDNIIQQLENSIALTTQMIVKEPKNRVFSTIHAILIDLKDELSKNKPDKERVGQMSYALVRGYQAVLHVEHMPFGKAIGKLLLELQKHN